MTFIASPRHEHCTAHGHCVPALCPSGRAPADWEGGHFSFDRRADQLLKEFFPRKVRISGITRAFQDRGKQPRFENLDAVFEYHSQAVDQVKGGPEWWEVHDDTMESAWVGLPRAEGWQRPLLQRADHVAELAKGLAVPARPVRRPAGKSPVSTRPLANLHDLSGSDLQPRTMPGFGPGRAQP